MNPRGPILAASLAVTSLAAQSPEVEIARALIEAHVPARTDPDQRAMSLLEVANRHARHPASRYLVSQARRLAVRAARPDDLLDAVEDYLGQDPTAGTVDARDLLADLTERTQGVRQGLSLRPYDLFVDRLLAIGPFGDSGNYYTHTPFGCELRFPDAGETIPGRYGPVAARIAERTPDQRDVDLAQPGSDHTGCFYGLYQVMADRDVDAYLEVTCTGSFEVFVNGVRVAVVDRYSSRTRSTQHIPIPLGVGHNHVLLKTTFNGYSKVRVRILDLAGRPPAGIAPFEDLPEVRRHVAPRSRTTDAPAFPDGLRRLADAAENAQGTDAQTLRLAVGLEAFRWRDDQLGMRMLHQLGDQPEPGPLGLAHAQLWLEASSIPADIRRGRARAAFEASRDQVDGHHHALLMAATFLEDEDKREDAIRLLERGRAAGDHSPETYDRLIRLYAGLRFSAEANRLRDEWRNAVPQDVRPVLSEASDRARDGDPLGALGLVNDALERHPNDALRRRALDLAREMGMVEFCEGMLAQLHAADPDSVSALADRAQTLRRLGQAGAATDAFAALAEHPDASAGQVHDAADALLAAHRDDEAIRAFERTLALDSSRHAVRRTLARLRGRPEFPDLARFRRDADELIAAFEPGEREQSATSTLVLDQLVVQFFSDGSSVSDTHLIRRINDLRGVEQHQTARGAAQADEVLHLRTVGTDGRSYVPNRVAGNFSMPRLEPGAFIDEAHRSFEDSPEPGPWRGPEFHFRSADEPYAISELVLILPPDHQGALRVRNFPEAPEIVDLESGNRAHVYRRTDVPRLPSERNPPAVADVIPLVAYGEDATPEATVRYQQANASWHGYVTPLVVETTRQVIAGANGDLERIRAIHRFVHDQIASDQDPQDPTAILMRKRGARFFLEAAMLRLSGVPTTDAVVADTHEDYSNDAVPLFLGEERYDIPALRVEPRNGTPFWLFVDLPRYAPVGTMPAQRLGAPALLIERGTARLTRLPSGQPETATGTEVRAEITIREDGTADMTAIGTLRGATGFYAADQVRAYEENLREMVAQQFAGRFFDGWKLRGASLVGIDEKGSPLAVEAELERRGALESAGDFMLLALPMTPTEFLGRFGDRPTRQMPLVLTDMHSTTTRLSIDPGPGYRFAEVPTSVRVRRQMIDFSLVFEREGDRILVTRTVVQRPGRVQPYQFGEWLETLRQLDLAEATNLKLVAR